MQTGVRKAPGCVCCRTGGQRPGVCLWPPGTLQAISCGGGDGGPALLAPLLPFAQRGWGCPAWGSTLRWGRRRSPGTPRAGLGGRGTARQGGGHGTAPAAGSRVSGGKGKSDFPIRGGRDCLGSGLGPFPLRQPCRPGGLWGPPAQDSGTLRLLCPGTSAPCLSPAHQQGSHPPAVIPWAGTSGIRVGEGLPAQGGHLPTPAPWGAPALAGQGSASGRKRSRMQPLMAIAEGT